MVVKKRSLEMGAEVKPEVSIIGWDKGGLGVGSIAVKEMFKGGVAVRIQA